RTQPAAPGRGRVPDPRPRAGPARARGSAGQLPCRQRRRLGAAGGRRLPEARAGRRRSPALGPGMAAGEDLRMTSSRSLALPGAIAESIQDGDTLAAIDLGSNSFHMIVARVTLGQLRIVDRLRETVRLGEGLYGKGRLDPVVRDRALACLSRF